MTVEQKKFSFIEDEEVKKSETTSTFSANLLLPIHRWFRYSAGFSAPWVRQLIEQEKREGRFRILDPFCGSGTVLLIGDSAPYGIHVPVDQWPGKLALAAGFSSYTFEKTRDRNVKWKNRKHDVPLHEGRLWVTG
jgi:hypothetical protein